MKLTRKSPRPFEYKMLELCKELQRKYSTRFDLEIDKLSGDFFISFHGNREPSKIPVEHHQTGVKTFIKIMVEKELSQ